MGHTLIASGLLLIAAVAKLFDKLKLVMWRASLYIVFNLIEIDVDPGRTVEEKAILPIIFASFMNIKHHRDEFLQEPNYSISFSAKDPGTGQTSTTL